MYIDKMQEIYRRADKEFQALVSCLKTKPVNEVIDAAYELTIKREFLSILENSDLDPDTLNTLYECPCPLACLYDEWLSNDYSFLDCLRDTMKDYAEKEVYSDDMVEMDEGEDLEP